MTFAETVASVAGLSLESDDDLSAVGVKIWKTENLPTSGALTPEGSDLTRLGADDLTDLDRAYLARTVLVMKSFAEDIAHISGEQSPGNLLLPGPSEMLTTARQVTTAIDEGDTLVDLFERLRNSERTA